MMNEEQRQVTIEICWRELQQEEPNGRCVLYSLTQDAELYQLFHCGLPFNWWNPAYDYAGISALLILIILHCEFDLKLDCEELT